MDADDLDLLLATARKLLDAGPPDALAAELDEAGLLDDPTVPAAVFELQGRMLARSTLLDVVMAGPAHRGGLRVVLPLPGASGPPGRTVGELVELDGIVLVPDGADALLVHSDRGPFVVDPAQLEVTAVTGFDPDLGTARMRGRVEPTAVHPTAPEDWATATTAGSRALAHEMLGVADHALAVAIEHVTTRRQFGRPIATFQAVRHRLVDVHVAIAAARAVLTGTQDDPGDALTALVGKALAGSAVLAAVHTAQQVCGAMGFTWEHGLHRAVRRAHVLDSLLGRGATLEAEIGARLAALRHAPRLASL